MLLTSFVANVKFKEHASVVWTWLYMQRLTILYSNKIFKAAQMMLLAKLQKTIPNLFLYNMELCSSMCK